MAISKSLKSIQVKIAQKWLHKLEFGWKNMKKNIH